MAVRIDCVTGGLPCDYVFDRNLSPQTVKRQSVRGFAVPLLGKESIPRFSISYHHRSINLITILFTSAEAGR